MWLTWLKTAAAGLLAFAALVGLAAVLRDRPYVYPVDVRCPWLTVYVRASPRHVALGGWRTADRDLYGTDQPYGEAAGIDVYTSVVDLGEERHRTDSLFASGHALGPARRVRHRPRGRIPARAVRHGADRADVAGRDGRRGPVRFRRGRPPPP